VRVAGGTFRISNGVIYGNDAAEEGLRNSAHQGAALSRIWTGGTSQRGTFSPSGMFTSLGNLNTTDNTIRVQNGQLVP